MFFGLGIALEGSCIMLFFNLRVLVSIEGAGRKVLSGVVERG